MLVQVLPNFGEAAGSPKTPRVRFSDGSGNDSPGLNGNRRTPPSPAKVCIPKPVQGLTTPPRPASPASSNVKKNIPVLRGWCPKCGGAVTTNDVRTKDEKTGKYYHETCPSSGPSSPLPHGPALDPFAFPPPPLFFGSGDVLPFHVGGPVSPFGGPPVGFGVGVLKGGPLDGMPVPTGR